MFHPDYKYITDKLPASLVKRAYQRLLRRSRDPVPLESISEKSERIESHLRHTLNVYANSLNRKHMSQKKILRPRSWPECNVSPDAVDNGVQTDNNTCIHEDENNHRVMNELKVLSQHLLNYNKRTFEKFMRDIEEEYNERVNANKKLRNEIENLKIQVQEAEKRVGIYENK